MNKEQIQGYIVKTGSEVILTSDISMSDSFKVTLENQLVFDDTYYPEFNAPSFNPEFDSWDTETEIDRFCKEKDYVPFMKLDKDYNFEFILAKRQDCIFPVSKFNDDDIPPF